MFCGTNIMKKFLVSSVALLAFATSASASTVYLDFEGIAPYPNNNDVVIGGFYNGGTSSIGTSGTNYGVEFTSDAILLCLNTAGVSCSNTSRGGQGIPTSQLGALYFPSANPTMNVAAGFDTGFSFVYSSPFSSGTSVSIFSGLNGTGSLLATAALPLTPDTGCDPAIAGGANYCPFATYSLAFGGIAQSVVFGGTANQQVFDDFTFGSTIVGGGVPEPATWAMMIGGFALAGAAMRRRRTATSFA